ncbi:MAG TPA: tetratricopeptide repeat protein [Terracidiphilus sp.]|nr:tetratricopeptide repeat protein [Terracidiphilus sp.]
MGVRRGPGLSGILLAACIPLATSAHAACNGPQALTANYKAHPTAQNAILLGSWFASHHQFACAVPIFRGALRTNPRSAQLHYLTGLALAGDGQTGPALPELEQATRLDPGVLKPHLMLAYLYDQAGKHSQAEQEWKAALKIDPHSDQALEGLSADLLDVQDYVGVVGLLQNVPLNPHLSITLARALGTLNYLDEAGAVLNRALQQQPASLPLADAMTVVLVKQNRNLEAIKLLEHTVQVNPGNLDAQLQLFRLLVLTNHINEARPIAPKLLAARPNDSEVLYLNGIIQRFMGNYPQAKAYLESAIAIDPNFFNSRYNLGVVLNYLHEWKEAAAQLQKAIDLGAPQPEAHFEMAKALRGLGENDRAKAELNTFQQMKKTDETKLEAATSAAQGDKSVEAGKVMEAVGHYRDAVQSDPTSANYHYKLALALDRAGDMEGEQIQLEAAVRIDPKLAGAQKQLGYVLSKSGDTAGSIEHFRLAVQAAPIWVEAWINLAGELAEAGRFPEAREAVATALRLDPANTLAHELSNQLAQDPAARPARP